MKNGYRITDAHAHVFPDKIAEKATEGISHFYDLPMEYHGRVAEMLENGMAAGVDNFLICSPATTVTQVHSINSFLASCAAAYPMCTAFGTLHRGTSRCGIPCGGRLSTAAAAASLRRQAAPGLSELSH